MTVTCETGSTGLLTSPAAESIAVKYERLSSSVHVSRFQGASGVAEVYLTAHPTRGGTFDAQLEEVSHAYREALELIGLDANTAIWRRFFCSDLPNQASALAARPFSNSQGTETPCAVSWVRQPPAPPWKVALCAYHVSDPRAELARTRDGTCLTLERGELSHHWTTGLARPGATSSYDQTRGILEDYEGFLKRRGLSLADHVVRTWFYVQNIDANYEGLVSARRECFATRGLTPETHYIASTGIEGGHSDVSAKVAMDAYAVSGLRAEQVEFLTAPAHMSPTHVYGVTFERGVAIGYRDRRHLFISGTASIDRTGQIVHRGNVARQLDRALENVDALLKTAGGGIHDMCHWVVYVRDTGDYALAHHQMRERVGDAPMTVVLAPVCRPGWLIEVEGQAILPDHRPERPAF